MLWLTNGRIHYFSWIHNILLLLVFFSALGDRCADQSTMPGHNIFNSWPTFSRSKWGEKRILEKDGKREPKKISISQNQFSVRAATRVQILLFSDVGSVRGQICDWNFITFEIELLLLRMSKKEVSVSIFYYGQCQAQTWKTNPWVEIGHDDVRSGMKLFSQQTFIDFEYLFMDGMNLNKFYLIHTSPRTFGIHLQ